MEPWIHVDISDMCWEGGSVISVLTAQALELSLVDPSNAYKKLGMVAHL